MLKIKSQSKDLFRVFKNKKYASIIIISHRAKNMNLVKCINELSKKNFIIKPPKFIRIEDLKLISPKLLNNFIKACERAAFGASTFRGKNDKIGADQAAVDQMRKELNLIDMRGKVVIGEGEMDEAPMLFIGERIGTGR